jgi:hypothetical protein
MPTPRSVPHPNSRAFALLLGFLSSACGPDERTPRAPQQAADESSPLGGPCYQLRFGGWFPALGPEASKRLARFVLVSDTLLRGDQGRHVPALYAKSDSQPAWQLVGTWRRLPADTLRLEFGSWSVGIAVFVPATGDVVRGRAEQYWDVRVYDLPRTNDVQAERITCPT